MLRTKKTIIPMAPRGLAPRLEEERPDQSPRTQDRLTDWPWLLLWLENRKNKLLFKKWEESWHLKDPHPLPFQHLHLQHFFISLAPCTAGPAVPGDVRAQVPSDAVAGMQL